MPSPNFCPIYSNREVGAYLTKYERYYQDINYRSTIDKSWLTDRLVKKEKKKTIKTWNLPCFNICQNRMHVEKVYQICK